MSATDLTHLCLTHFHGDHCLGVPGIVQRLSLDRVPHPVLAHYPASGAHYFERLRHASSFHEAAELRELPVTGDGVVSEGPQWTIEARALDHAIECFGYRLVERDGVRMLPERLREFGISGPDVGRVRREGALRVGERTVTLDQVGETRRGQRFALVMDTRLCDGVYALAEGADLLVIESTFLREDERLAVEYGHLTAAQAAGVAAQSGVRTLVLTHFSQRYDDPARFHDEAAEIFDGEIVVAEDLRRYPLPPRR